MGMRTVDVIQALKEILSLAAYHRTLVYHLLVAPTLSVMRTAQVRWSVAAEEDSRVILYPPRDAKRNVLRTQIALQGSLALPRNVLIPALVPAVYSLCVMLRIITRFVVVHLEQLEIHSRVVHRSRS